MTLTQQTILTTTTQMKTSTYDLKKKAGQQSNDRTMCHELLAQTYHKQVDDTSFVLATTLYASQSSEVQCATLPVSSRLHISRTAALAVQSHNVSICTLNLIVIWHSVLWCRLGRMP